MGNQTSTATNTTQDKTNTNTELKPKSVSQILDYIATHYILTMDFKSLRKLYDKTYCDKLVVLTSDIIERYFTDMEITYLAQRVKDGVEINELASDKVIFFDRDNLDKLDVQNSIKKKRLCLGIAKFYIKIAHIFAAIVTTINPVYVYKDTEGNTVKATLYEKSKIPKNTPRDIYKLNICDNRINSLKNKNSLEPDEEGNIYVGPKVCNVNVNDRGETKSLGEEPGIPELMELYYDDNYDFNTGKFTGMTEKTKQIFNNDLKIFYNIFTGNASMPSEITKFSDIKLREYHKTSLCEGSNPVFARKYKGPSSNKLFQDYANNLKSMMEKANKNQNALLSIINQIFVYTIDPQTGKKQIRITPKLSESKLQDIVVETRALIIKLYLTCEMDYLNGIKLFEAIVEKKIFETSQNQIDSLKKIKEELNSTEESVSESVKNMEQQATEQQATEQQATEQQATEQQATEQQATEQQATEKNTNNEQNTPKVK